ARGKVWTGEQASKIGLVDKLGGLREVLAAAREKAHLPDDAPIIELPEEDDSLLGFLLNLVGLQAAGVGPGGALALPPAFLQLARALAPFLIFEPDRALARSEVFEDEAPSSDDVHSRFRAMEP